MGFVELSRKTEPGIPWESFTAGEVNNSGQLRRQYEQGGSVGRGPRRYLLDIFD